MKLKKFGKIILSSIVAATLFLTATAPANVASAQEEKTTYLKDVSSKKHVTYYKYNSNECTIAQFDLKNYDDKITIKCSSKNMYAGVMYKSSSYSKSGEVENGNGSANVSAVFKKTGTYKVTITEKTSKGKVVYTKNIKIYCNTSGPVKKVTLNGKENFYGLVNIKSGKFKVTINKGYKLKKIEYGVYNKNSNNMTWKTIKNGGKVIFGKYPCHYENKSEYGDKDGDYYNYYENMSEELVARTIVKITYTDKYTKETETTSYWYFRYLQ